MISAADENHCARALFVQPTGWSSVDTAEAVRERLCREGFDPSGTPCVATGYGRVAVPFAGQTVTEITCHAQGAMFLHGLKDLIVIDIGGQDTKIIRIEGGKVIDFIMNDKCSAGTGRFLEVMANTMGLRPDELCALAEEGGGTSISSMCTVFAESEVISLIGRGEEKENIAFAVVDSIVKKVASQAGRVEAGSAPICLTGGLCQCDTIGQFTREHGLLLVVDASQTAGCIPIDIEKAGIDVLCFTGHKGMFGPQGTGGMCIRQGLEIRPWKVGGSGVQSYSPTQPKEYPTRLEAGTLNGHGLAGMSAAMDFLSETGLETIHAKEISLMRRFYEGVKDIRGIKLYGDYSTDNRTAIVALNLADFDSGAVSDALAEDYGIATRPGAHCAPRMHEALGTREQGAVRFSFSWYNSEDEIDTATRALRELAV